MPHKILQHLAQALTDFIFSHSSHITHLASVLFLTGVNHGLSTFPPQDLFTSFWNVLPLSTHMVCSFKDIAKCHHQ